jgi:gag-polyprotein putative aspartyl protease
VQKAKRLRGCLGLVASLLSLGCAPRFPTGVPATVLPIADPLFDPSPFVLVTLPGGEGPWSTWMYVDSGVVDSAIVPSASVARLGPHYGDWGVTWTRFSTGPRQVARAGLLSSLALGDLVVRDVPVRVTRLDSPMFPPRCRSGLLGQGILGHAPWEIDWDRGTLTLGATPWPEAPDVIVVPLRRRWGGQDIVTVQVDGHPVEMILDTGTDVSVIPADIAREAGLSVHAAHSWNRATGKETSGDVVLGPLRLGRIEFMSFPEDRFGYGLLGLDVLSRYRIQVVPGERLALRPRGDSWESARERIARWPWTRACPSLGCLRARAEPAGDDARLVFSFEVDVPRPVALLLGCREADPAGAHLPTRAERLTSGRARALPHHIFLRVASAVKDQTFETTVVAGNDWLSRTQCREVSVLDVMPVSRDSIAGGAVAADIIF